MRAHLQVVDLEGQRSVALTGERVTLGKARANTIVLRVTTGVSRLHAAIDAFPAGWCIRDLASRNGTFVNGQRILGERPLRDGDEIRLGSTRLVYRLEETDGEETSTGVVRRPPRLTERERDVLEALCLPVVSGDIFTEPASLREIADALLVTEAAVKQHLLHLYEKFEVDEAGGRRRVRLANEAIRRGAVNLLDLRARRVDRQGRP